MVFQQCSVGGKVYRGDSDPAESRKQKGGVSSAHIRSSENINGSNDAGFAITSSDVQLNQLQPSEAKVTADKLVHFRDGTLTKDLAEAISVDPESDNAPHARNLNGFFSVLALCHTVVAYEDPVTGVIEYRAQSPDEAALVQAAADVGFVFLGRDRETLKLRTPFSKEVEKYELLNILEFTSARKRMSVVLKKLDSEDGRLMLLTKGADNVIFERLKLGSDHLKETTEKQLDEFANNGLRTLTLAYKIISSKSICSCNVPSLFRFRDANLFTQRVNTSHGAKGIMKPRLLETTETSRLRRSLTN